MSVAGGLHSHSIPTRLVGPSESLEMKLLPGWERHLDSTWINMSRIHSNLYHRDSKVEHLTTYNESVLCPFRANPQVPCSCLAWPSLCSPTLPFVHRSEGKAEVLFKVQLQDFFVLSLPPPPTPPKKKKKKCSYYLPSASSRAVLSFLLKFSATVLIEQNKTHMIHAP